MTVMQPAVISLALTIVLVILVIKAMALRARILMNVMRAINMKFILVIKMRLVATLREHIIVHVTLGILEMVGPALIMMSVY